MGVTLDISIVSGESFPSRTHHSALPYRIGVQNRCHGATWKKNCNSRLFLLFTRKQSNYMTSEGNCIDGNLYRSIAILRYSIKVVECRSIYYKREQSKEVSAGLTKLALVSIFGVPTVPVRVGWASATASPFPVSLLSPPSNLFSCGLLRSSS